MPSPRTPTEVRRDGNLLRDEPSLYLRQHAHNPVDWRPWGADALAEAAARDCPVFLSIGYSSCHWCHVMEKEAFDDDAIADFLNRHFVCIKVDREERPDLDAVYMDAVQALTGRGGWPMSSFLTPEGQPFHGGTYFPPAQFRHLVEQVAALWRERPGDLREQARRVASHVAEVPEWAGRAGAAPDPAWLEAAASFAGTIFDGEHGGFRQRQKFPTPVKWRFLVRQWQREGGDRLRAMVEQTLAAMAGGGLRDHVGGGFFRYTVDEAWTVPHFEKMLYDNAQLASLFLEAGRAFDREAYREVARDTLRFLVDGMRGDHGGLFASYDADSGGHEGSYYVWTPDEVRAAVGAAEAAGLCTLLGITDEGNFEHTGSSVPSRRGERGERGGRPDWDDSGGAPGLFARHRAALVEARARRTPPGLDCKVVTAWNGLAIAALARGGVECGEPAFIEAAGAAAGFLLDRHRRADGSLWRATSDGRPAGEGVLDDYACLAGGLVELFTATGEARWLAAARELAGTALARFAHPDGGWHLVPAGAEAPLGRPVELFDNVEPSGNASLLQALLKLAALTGEVRFARAAEQALVARSGLLARAGLDVAGWLLAAQLQLEPPAVVVVAGEAHDAAAAALLAAARSAKVEALVVAVPAAGAPPALAAIAPALAGKGTPGAVPAAWICRGMACEAPVTEAHELARRLDG